MSHTIIEPEIIEPEIIVIHDVPLHVQSIVDFFNF